MSATAVTCSKCGKSLPETANFCPACGEDLRGLTPLSDTLSGAWSGKVIDDRYAIKEKLGEGGMGAVFKVEHLRMGKVLAVKVLRADLAVDKKMKARFQQEARVVSKLSHPNTIQVFDFGELDDGSLYIAMEYLSGRDLAWTLRAHGPLSEERAIAVGIQVLSSLAEAHELGIIHRDIKPANVMLQRRRDGGDQVKVLDFGIAQLHDGEGRKSITGVEFLGTPAYMSPEQGRGEPLDARSDLYSVGAMLFELVSGSWVFNGPTPMSIVTKHMTEPPPRLAQVAPERVISPAFEQVIRRALAKEPTERFASADEMRLSLEAVRRDLGGALDVTPMMEASGELARREDFDRFERSLRLRRVLLPVAVLGLLVAAGAWGYRTYQLVGQGQRTPTTEEREPNDDPQHATPIALGTTVQGRIGAARSDTESDRDVYVVEIGSEGAVSVELAGIADLNLVLEAYQFDGGGAQRKLVRRLLLDDGRTGFGERVDGLRVSPGPLYLSIQEHAHPSEPPRPPRESTRLSYTLEVKATPLKRLEHEPENDLAETAPAQPLAEAVRAYTGEPLPTDPATFFDAASGADWFRIDADPSAKVGVVVVPPEQGELWVYDFAEVDASRPPRDRPAPAERVVPKPVRVRRQPRAFLVAQSALGREVRVQTRAVPKGADDAKAFTPPGSVYYLAFFDDSAEGLRGVKDLLELLGDEGLYDQRRLVMDAVKGALGDTPALSKLATGLDVVPASGTAH